MLDKDEARALFGLLQRVQINGSEAEIVAHLKAKLSQMASPQPGMPAAPKQERPVSSRAAKDAPAS